MEVEEMKYSIILVILQYIFLLMEIIGILLHNFTIFIVGFISCLFFGGIALFSLIQENMVVQNEWRHQTTKAPLTDNQPIKLWKKKEIDE